MPFYREKVFPVLNDFLTRSFVRHRLRVLQSAHGRVLEIGFGTGLSLACYPAAVTQIIGIDPSAGMRHRAQGRPDPRLELRAGEAEHLPFADREFDGVTSFLTLCSVTDLSGALREVRRVLKPGGRLFFIEHVAQPPRSATRAIQHALQPFWTHFACGCSLERETIDELKKTFEIEALKPLGYSGFPNFLGPIYRGIATPK